jgi:ATP-dependent DNA ligase
LALGFGVKRTKLGAAWDCRAGAAGSGEFKVRDAILDGEVVALDDEGRLDFRALLAGKGWLHYAAFDLLWLTGRT